MNPKPTLMALLLTAATAASAPAAPTLDPGSPGGPAIFTSADAPHDTSCSSLPGLPSLSGCAALPGGPADRLQAGTFTLSPIGLARTRVVARASRHNDFTVAPAQSGLESVVQANVSAAINVRGALAAMTEGRAGVHVRLSVLDITGGVANAPVVASRSLFDDEVSGAFSPGLGVSPGVMLPVPDGHVSFDVSFSAEGAKKVLDDDADGSIQVLLQRGRTYRVEITLEAESDIGVAGGVGFAAFGNALGGGLDSMPDLTAVETWLSQLDPLLEIPDLNFDESIFNASIDIPGLGEVEVFPGYEQAFTSFPGYSRNVGFPGYSNTIQSFPGFDYTFTTFPGFSWHVDIDDGGPLPRFGFGVPGFQANVDIPSHSFFINIPSQNIPINIPSQSLTVEIPEATLDIPDQTVNLPLAGAFGDFESLLDAIGLPDFVNNLDVSEAVGWLDFPTLPIDEVFDGSGVLVETLTVTLQDDLHEQADANLAQAMANDDANAGTIVQNDDQNTSTIVQNADANAAAIVQNDDVNRDAILANDDENAETLLEAIRTLRDDSRRRDIQAMLDDGRCAPWMYTPRTLGASPSAIDGQLELTFKVVTSVIADARTLGWVAERDLSDAEEALVEAHGIATTAPPLSEHDATRICHLLIGAYQQVTARGTGR